MMVALAPEESALVLEPPESVAASPSSSSAALAVVTFRLTTHWSAMLLASSVRPNHSISGQLITVPPPK